MKQPKKMGIIRRVDNLGRIVIPAETRNMLMIGLGDWVEVFAQDDMVCLKKYYADVIYTDAIKCMISALDETGDKLQNKEKVAQKLGEVLELLKEGNR